MGLLPNELKDALWCEQVVVCYESSFQLVSLISGVTWGILLTTDQLTKMSPNLIPG